jgi:hypothetical protein
MKVIVAGSRDFKDSSLIFAVLDHLHSRHGFTAIVCGMAQGPDLIGKEWADSRGIEVMEFPANWKKYKNAAGPIRNSEMAEVADFLVAFWDGESTGTKDMISKMRNKVLHLHRIDKEGPIDL